MRSDRVSVYSEYVSGAAKFAAVHLVLGSEVVVVIDLQRSIPAVYTEAGRTTNLHRASNGIPGTN